MTRAKVKDSLLYGFSFLGFVELIFAIAGINISIIFSCPTLAHRLAISFSIYLICALLAYCWIWLNNINEVTISIKGTTVHIKKGDIFNEQGWKVIPFNENFDTKVDDIVISHKSLNGIFIDKYVPSTTLLNEKIKQANILNTQENPNKYLLGTVITYDSFMLLALTHFDNNYAHLSVSDYERCLRVMWKEIEKQYATLDIAIPLLGSGITRFDGIEGMSNSDLLYSILYALKTSNTQIKSDITIVLTEKVYKQIDLYKIKKYF